MNGLYVERSPASDAVDPVRVRRAQVAKWTLLANRIGYLFFALSIALFVIGFAVGFSSTMATLVIISFVIGCVLLAPSIIARLRRQGSRTRRP